MARARLESITHGCVPPPAQKRRTLAKRGRVFEKSAKRTRTRTRKRRSGNVHGRRQTDSVEQPPPAPGPTSSLQHVPQCRLSRRHQSRSHRCLQSPSPASLPPSNHLRLFQSSPVPRSSIPPLTLPSLCRRRPNVQRRSILSVLVLTVPIPAITFMASRHIVPQSVPSVLVLAPSAFSLLLCLLDWMLYAWMQRGLTPQAFHLTFWFSPHHESVTTPVMSALR